ncbi:alpha/beta hydrolase [Kangiella profundi]|nr:alpha/beta hydrolase [Kangiella profundi]
MIYPAHNQTDSKKYLIIGSAFGVPQQYYKHITNYFAEQGISCLTFDYRGIGESKTGLMPAQEMLMQHWGQLDLEGVIQYVERNYRPEQLYYLGHSAGGQILGLAPSCDKFYRVILAATGVGAWRAWLGAQKYLLAAMWYGLMPLMMLLQRGDFFHSKMLGPIPVPKHAVKQWVEWAKSEDYLFTAKHGLDLTGYKNIKAEIYALTISDDWYAPQSSRDALLAHYSNSHRETQYILPQDVGLKKIGHFGLFRKKQEIVNGIWQPMINFLNQ